jgi:hypothetical protein
MTKQGGRTAVKYNKEFLKEKILTAVKKNEEIMEDLDFDPPSEFELKYLHPDALDAPFRNVSLAELTAQVTKDVSKVYFSSENFGCFPEQGYNNELGFHTLDNDFTYLGCMGGGDWEFPVFYIIYWDGKKLRGYVPTDGNMFNRSTMMAYGNDGESEKANSRTDEEDAAIVYPKFADELKANPDMSMIDSNNIKWDNNRITTDIMNRINLR